MSTPQPNISIIVALAANLAIGKDNSLLWHIRDDMQHFKKLTTGHPIIMGRRTFLSLPKRPLPNRTNIVLTHNTAYSHPDTLVCHTPQQALALVADSPEAFVIGGAAVYQAFLPYATTIYATHILQTFPADTFFPPINPAHFAPTSQSPTHHDPDSNLDYYFATYHRISV